ncbi:MAG: MFS transporter [Reyranella sp.]|uniref:MFS transporter n=1 Tax=Reyranella sp. TaxID=1929291 RepID=UPI003D1353F1
MSRSHGRVPYGWVIVGAGMLISCVAMGSVFSLAVFLQPLTADTGWSRTGVSTAMTIDFLAMGVSAFGWGILTDRWGTRGVVLAGSVMMGAGLILASRATSLLEFQLLYGLIVGAAAGAFYAPLMTVVTLWFEKNRSLAVALVSAGMGMAPLTVAPFARWLITTYEWRPAMMTVGIVAWILMIPAALLIRRAPVIIPAPTPLRGVATPMAAPRREPLMTAGQALRTPQFAALALAHFACCAAHSGPIFHMVTYAIGCGIAPMTAVTVYSVAGLAGLGGRLLLGVSADRLGAKPVLVAGLAVQALAAGTYIFVGQLDEFYALAVVFGIAYGGVMPLYAILARDYFGGHIMGTTFGAISMAASIGMAFGPWAGGYVFDAYASYALLYIGSFSVGLAAVAVALSFKPLPAAARLRAAAKA